MSSKQYLIVFVLVICVCVVGFSNKARASFCDPDEDGYNSMYLCGGNDCNDSDPTINPGITEVCDGIDNNCDGQADEDVLIIYYVDADGDGYGDPASTTVEACTATAGYVDNAGDCDDNPLTGAAVNPSVTEDCTDAIDNNCNGTVNEGCTITACDADGDGYDSNDASCGGTDCNDGDAIIHPGMAESCDGVDNDCDGTVDNGVLQTFYADTDADGYGDVAVSTTACSVSTGYVDNLDDCDDTDPVVNPSAAEVCGDTVDNNCSGGLDDGCGSDFCDRDGDGALNAYCTSTNVDCNDADARRYPGASEICDGVDNDCDDLVDLDDTDSGLVGTDYYADADGDGYGDAAVSTTACAVPDGYIEDDTDCNDSVAASYPGAAEQCDGLDNDCDGDIDNDVTYSDYYADADGDGYGNPDDTRHECVQPVGYVEDNTDCDDGVAGVNPGVSTDVCGGVDDDCDDAIDEDCVTTACDVDGDGYDSDDASCGGTDCNDSDPLINPSAPSDVCDGADNDCDGVADEDCATTVCDADGDGYDTNVVSADCDGTGTDCNDSDANVHPDAAEVCDFVDNNCDGVIDTDAVDAMTVYADRDGDRFGDPAVSRNTCARITGFVVNALDCDDHSPRVNPAVDEVCGDGVDNNFYGIVDGPDAVDALRWYADSDGDGYGDSADSILDCTQPTDCVSFALDCDDTDAAINPLAEEYCGDGIDNDCNAIAEESCHFDSIDDDGDGYTEYQGDCDDYNARRYPGAPEVCDGLDNDCNGLYDDEDSGLNLSTTTAWYADNDHDGFGDAGTMIQACQQPSVNFVLYGTDCYDDNHAAFPGADEVCGDGIDNNCDGTDDVCSVAEVTDETEPSISAELKGGSSACSLNALPMAATSGSGSVVLLLALLGLRVFRFKK